MMIFSGSGSRRLSKQICRYLDVELRKSEALQFSEGNIFVRVLENVRGRKVYLVQSTLFPANDNFMELLFWIDAFKRASAESVTAIIPYLSYGKGDKKDEPRVSIRARVCADAIESAGADRMVAMDLHAPQIQGFFRIPVDALYALPVLCEAIRKLGLVDPVVVSPDAGFVKRARQFARRLDATVAIADKQRLDHSGGMVLHEITGDVAGKCALIVDDFTIGGGTLLGVAEALKQRGATEVYAAVTHGVFTQDCMARLDDSPIDKLLATDTVETQPVELSRKVEVVSVAPLLAEAIRRIHTRQSISVLFDGEV